VSDAPEAGHALPGAPQTRHALSGAFIGISGLIGAGKTTLAHALGERLWLDVHHAPLIDDELRAALMDFPERHSFAAQVHLLTQRFKQQQALIWRGRGGIQDRTFIEDIAYARLLSEQGKLSRREYDIYMDLYQAVSRAMTRPDLIIFLDVSPETAQERILERKRGRQAETTLQFLGEMRDTYEVLIREVCQTIPVIRTPYDVFWDYDILARELCSSYARLGRVDELPAPPAGLR
jgi:deoxyadenosine/deoxycytidine kinase